MDHRYRKYLKNGKEPLRGIMLEILKKYIYYKKKHYLGSQPKGLASFVLLFTVINLGFAMWKYCK